MSEPERATTGQTWCVVRTCRDEIDRPAVMCADHWARVPERQKWEIADSYLVQGRAHADAVRKAEQTVYLLERQDAAQERWERRRDRGMGPPLPW